MKRLLSLVAFASLLLTALPPLDADPAAKVEAPLIVLKLDDMVAREGKVPPRWQRVVDFAVERNIKISIGIICNSLAVDNPEYFAGLKKIAATGLVEFWHHGYNHKSWEKDGTRITEFSRSDYERQRDHMLRGLNLVQEKLGIRLHAFGAPYNATDDTTIRVLSEIPEMRVWLYGKPNNIPGMFTARRVGSVNIESPVHKPNLAALAKGFERELPKDPRYFVLQGHAGGWDDSKFEEFVRIVDYLTEKGCKFVFPSELPVLLAETKAKE